MGVLRLFKDFVLYYRAVSAYREPRLDEASRAYLFSLSPESESSLDSVLGDSLMRKALNESLSQEFVKGALFWLEARRSLIRRTKADKTRSVV